MRNVNEVFLLIKSSYYEALLPAGKSRISPPGVEFIVSGGYFWFNHFYFVVLFGPTFKTVCVFVIFKCYDEDQMPPQSDR